MITNEMKLSKEQIAKVFGLYLGAECLYGSEDDKQTGILTGADIGGGVPNAYVNGICHVPTELCQLILKPLSEITDEDKREFLEVTGMEPDGLELFLLGHGSMHLSHLQDWANGVDFLRSRGYALPYMGIDLFQSSLAIPKQ